MRRSSFQNRHLLSSSWASRCGPSVWVCAWVTALFWGAPAASGLNPEHRLTQYVHRIWQTQPGLPQTAIFAVSQTRDGYLWLGTGSGVVRFDGVRFTPVPELERAQLDDEPCATASRESIEYGPQSSRDRQKLAIRPAQSHGTSPGWRVRSLTALRGRERSLFVFSSGNFSGSRESFLARRK